MIYFDNAATSFKKPISVKFSTLVALYKYSANPGRSGHRLSIKTAQKVLETRLRVADFFNCPSFESVIFTKNCTEALNLAILGSAKENSHVIASCFEHNSVLRPLKYLESIGKIKLTIIQPKNKLENIKLTDIVDKVKENTSMICVNHISNVTGNKNDIEEIGKFCKLKNILFLVDCAQSAGHIKIDMQKLNIDLLAFAGHKGLFAPQSIGGLCINTKNSPKAILFGGTGTNSKDLEQPKTLPEYYESGTISTPLILGLSAGIKYVEKNFCKNNNKTKKLTNYLYDNLKKVKDVYIYTKKESHYGVVTFNIKNMNSSEVATILDEKYKICVRSGLHCAPLAHNYLQTLEQGAVRISLNHFNNKHQINKLIFAINQIINKKTTAR